jgi:hypothetical protein
MSVEHRAGFASFVLGGVTWEVNRYGVGLRRVRDGEFAGWSAVVFADNATSVVLRRLAAAALLRHEREGAVYDLRVLKRLADVHNRAAEEERFYCEEREG